MDTFDAVLRALIFRSLFTYCIEDTTGAIIGQLTLTCLKSTIETLEKVVKYVQSQQYKHQNDIDVVLVFLLLTWNTQNDVSDVVLVFLLLTLNK